MFIFFVLNVSFIDWVIDNNDNSVAPLITFYLTFFCSHVSRFFTVYIERCVCVWIVVFLLTVSVLYSSTPTLESFTVYAHLLQLSMKFSSWAL